MTRRLTTAQELHEVQLQLKLRVESSITGNVPRAQKRFWTITDVQEMATADGYVRETTRDDYKRRLQEMTTADGYSRWLQQTTLFS